MTWELTACPFCGGTDIERRHTGGVNDQQCQACWGYWSEADLPTIADRHVCPRRGEAPAGRMTVFSAGSDFWRVRDGQKVCSYCGSLNPDTFMEWCRSGVMLGSTTKSYKVYVSPATGDPDGTAVDIGHANAAGVNTFSGKFYFMHLSEDQRREFVDLYNAKATIGFEGGFGFSVLPFFMSRAS